MERTLGLCCCVAVDASDAFAFATSPSMTKSIYREHLSRHTPPCFGNQMFSETYVFQNTYSGQDIHLGCRETHVGGVRFGTDQRSYNTQVSVRLCSMQGKLDA